MLKEPRITALKCEEIATTTDEAQAGLRVRLYNLGDVLVKLKNGTLEVRAPSAKRTAYELEAEHPTNANLSLQPGEVKRVTWFGELTGKEGASVEIELRFQITGSVKPEVCFK